MKKLILVFIVAGVLGVAVVGVKAALFLGVPMGSAAGTSAFEVPPGVSFTRVANDLEDKGYISSALYFKIYAKILGKTGEIRVGEYAISPEMTPPKILEVISSGVSIQSTFTVPEGENIFEVADILANREIGTREEFLQLFRDRNLTQKLLGEDLPSFEGYLFPETYSYTKYTTPEEVLEMMVESFKRVWNEVGGQHGNLSRHQIVTLASVVEKETGAPEERPVIASVFHNRLRKKMRLQSDPTILYGILMETGVMKKNIRKKDILRPTPYNTYTVRALPAGPIASPGKEAIAAVLNPKSTEFLYFVSRNDGTHVFSRTYEEHNKAVREYQLNRRARKGKSWRDLEKRKGDGSQRTDI